MKRFTVSVSDKEFEYISKECRKKDITKSIFISELLSVYRNDVPGSIRYRDLVRELGSLGNSMNEIVLNERFSSSDRMLLYEKCDEIRKLIMKDYFPSEFSGGQDG